MTLMAEVSTTTVLRLKTKKQLFWKKCPSGIWKKRPLLLFGVFGSERWRKRRRGVMIGKFSSWHQTFTLTSVHILGETLFDSRKRRKNASTESTRWTHGRDAERWCSTRQGRFAFWPEACPSCALAVFRYCNNERRTRRRNQPRIRK